MHTLTDSEIVSYHINTEYLFHRELYKKKRKLELVFLVPTLSIILVL